MSLKSKKDEFQKIIYSNDWFMEVLRTVRKCNPPNWYVGAGVIRNIVWDHFHSYKYQTPVKDIDVAFFDENDLSQERDQNIQNQLQAIQPEILWEATNQASVHLWFENYFGYPVNPLKSCEDAIATWPETVTSIGVRLLDDDSLKIEAPFGFEDLFNMILRRNPSRLTIDLFKKRYQEKQIIKKWPKVKVIDD
jgi:hypothetical protein